MASINKGTRRSTTRSCGFSTATRMTQRQAVPQPVKYNVEVQILMPMPNHGFNDPQPSDVDFQTTLDQIRKQFGVKIEINEDDVRIELKAITRKKAYDAANALKKILARKPGDKNIWHPTVSVKPPKGGKERREVILVAQGPIRGTRPTALPQFASVRSSEGEAAEAAVTFKNEFIKALETTMGNLEYVPNKMRMRVNFGTFLLHEWKKDQPRYSFAELERIAQRAGPRGTAHLHTHIGDNNTVKRIRELLSLRFPGSLPLEARVDAVSDIKPMLSLVLLTKNLCVESGIETIRGKTALGSVDKPKQQHNLGHLNVFHRERRRRAVKIMISCPENHHDWALEVENQVDIDDNAAVPFTEAKLKEHVEFEDSTMTGDFPRIKVSSKFRDFTKANAIESIIGKSSWSWMINSFYVVEVSLYHRWGNDPSLPPVSGAELSMYGCDWDYDMERADVSTGPRKWCDFANQFFKVDWETTAREIDAYDDFLSRVELVQDMLFSAST